MHPLAVAAAAPLFCLALPAQDKDLLYTVSSGVAALRRVDPVTFTTISSVGMTATGFGIRWANGLSVHPGTGELYVVVTVTGTSARQLGKVDPVTGVVTMIGSLGQQFAGIAFTATGALYGVTGDGATTPETLYSIDVNTAATTQVLALGNGSDGETICLHPSGRLLHASGLNQQVFESIDLTALQVTNIPLSGDPWSEVLSITHFAGRNFLAADLNDDVFVVTDAGVVNKLGTLDHTLVKGIAFAPAANNVASFRLYGEGCPAASSLIPMLAGSGAPAPGASIVLGVANGPAMVPAVMSIGSANAVFNLTPTCALQNMPIFPAPIVPLSLGGTNPGDGTAALPITIPASLRPIDLFFQSVIVELPGPSLVVTNPLVMRIR